jgi:hypothetical protein
MSSQMSETRSSTKPSTKTFCRYLKWNVVQMKCRTNKTSYWWNVFRIKHHAMKWRTNEINCKMYLFILTLCFSALMRVTQILIKLNRNIFCPSFLTFDTPKGLGIRRSNFMRSKLIFSWDQIHEIEIFLTFHEIKIPNIWFDLLIAAVGEGRLFE